MAKPQLSSYLEYLPAYLETDPFLGKFLLAFEGILSGIPEAETQFSPQIVDHNTPTLWGLETLISQIHTYFDPQQTPAEFLPWLAGWVALSLRDDWDEKTKRQFISQIVPLYQIRGTVPGMKKMLEIYLESSGLSYPERTISIFEFDQKPHYFQVQLALPSNQVIHPERYWREFRIAKGIIDQEKPAHTYYALRILTLTMQITQAWGGCYPFILFDAPPQQKMQIEAKIQLDDYPEGDSLEQQILIRIQGKNLPLEPNGSQLGPVVKQTVFYHQFTGNPDGFFIALSNLSDRQLTGKITVQLNFNLNHQQYSLNIFDSLPFNLEPNLRIYRPFNQLELMPGNTRLDSDPEQTVRLQAEPPLNIYQQQIKWIDGNTRLGSKVGQTMRLVHDARLRIYKPRPLLDRMEGNTRLGNQVGESLQIPTGTDDSQLKIYRHHQEYKIGNTRLGTEVGATMRLVTNSQWLERIYRFQLFDSPVKKKIEIEAIVELRGIAEHEGEKIARLLVLRIQSCTSSFRPFMPNLEFSAQGIRATHQVSYQRFLDNPQGFYVVLSNINDCQVAGNITIKLNFNLNRHPVSQVILQADFNLSPRANVLEMCHLNNQGEVAGNTIIGRVTPQMLRASTIQEEAWVD
ncbi:MULTISPECIES: phage tail protein [unclassified Tolypothrix]|uniref:phage tail protein n=1 Tax=unclassified Tolypothrix TaxID=2649714 RepID=UPI0005EAC3EA|nr:MULTISPECIES: phage tail protein [unclassified Tolypothrix]BAY90278.1 phage tail protein [Microchaete diplosiphon NIES-3275]EKE98907.1 putative bacteriophage tail protein [Tolypothrix sp. PCC 7601]MBE9083364.1 phage tail protein [Tolypothrix sp. LEGE 11397]UYD24467.1 phage tail protein [Tolypothrix sp. PCC 7712]UYD33301.1 phage tail protein [Tolypothrix sp. PCC 7601]